MTSIVGEITRWAATLPYWEQAALCRLMSGVQLSESDYAELLRYMLEDEGLSSPTQPRPTLCFPQAPASETWEGPPQLLQISDLKGVNALAPGQLLNFGPAVTAIYGANGSGKSGYARVLGCAGFTRGDREVLPDVTSPIEPGAVQSATIRIGNGVTTRDLLYDIGAPCTDLASVYVFDNTSVRVHLSKPNSIGFSPGGLAWLTDLAEATDAVRRLLAQEIDRRSVPHGFSSLFVGASEVSEYVNALGPDSDLQSLHALAAVTPAETADIDRLDTRIAQLVARDVPAQLRTLDQEIADLEDLVERVQDARDGLDEHVEAEVGAEIAALTAAQAAAREVSIERFQHEGIARTGSEAWHAFVRAARALADTEGVEGAPYPQAQSVCLLCHQALSPESRELLTRLWAFLDGDAQERVRGAEARLAERRKSVAAVDLGFLGERSVGRRHLLVRSSDVLQLVTKWIEDSARRRAALIVTIDTHTAADLEEPPHDPMVCIADVVAAVRTERDGIAMADPSEELAELERQVLALRHRVVLGQHQREIEDWVSGRAWARRAGLIGGSTRHITSKYNELFKELVTDRYVVRFEEIFSQFGRPVRVVISTKARKGEVYKQVMIETHPSVSTERSPPDRVLSEGEKRAVALADFLTEVALDSGSGTIVMDDPVTSLDLEWKGVAAHALVSEARSRQVVVFTHDLPFLYLLKKCGDDLQVSIVTHWVRRGEHDDKPGYVFLENSPALEREYRRPTRAREIYSRAKRLPPASQEALLREGFGALRTTYEAFIVFELLNEVVVRFDERISFGRLAGVVWDPSIAKEVVRKCEELSRYIEGHLHSDGMVRPNSSTLLEEIEAFEALAKRHRELKSRHPESLPPRP